MKEKEKQLRNLENPKLILHKDPINMTKQYISWLWMKRRHTLKKSAVVSSLDKMDKLLKRKQAKIKSRRKRKSEEIYNSQTHQPDTEKFSHTDMEHGKRVSEFSPP